MKKIVALLLIFTLAFGLYGCAGSNKSNEGTTPDGNASTNENTNPIELTISAAASLTEAYNELKDIYESENNVKLTFNYAASGPLQKQIEEGADVDVFISAGQKQMNELEEKDLIHKDTREDIYRNELVLIVPEEYKDEIKSIHDIIGTDLKLCIGVPETVPVGQYSKEALEYLKLWDKLEPNIILAKDVSQVLAYVEKGEVAGGMVYSSDTVRAKQSYLAEVFAEETHRPIVYPAAVIASSNNKEAGVDFLNYLKTEDAKKILESYGFKIYTE